MLSHCHLGASCGLALRNIKLTGLAFAFFQTCFLFHLIHLLA